MQPFRDDVHRLNFKLKAEFRRAKAGSQKQFDVLRRVFDELSPLSDELNQLPFDESENKVWKYWETAARNLGQRLDYQTCELIQNDEPRH